MAQSGQLDVRDWNQQAKVFGQAIHALGGRIDYVYSIAGINERRWIDNNPSAEGFQAPDLSVLDVDVTGLMYTVSLAVQQFRRQDKDSNGFRGKIGCVASVCGFYCCPTLPIYTAAKQ
jgi:NAD(P)-dependent dehydrogenase (short-subunit alcohol dehydrogenase family)